VAAVPRSTSGDAIACSSSFYVKKYRAYTGRNPKTGRKVKIKPKKLPYFKCGKELRERIDYN
jgi:integration host factor subunit beta